MRPVIISVVLVCIIGIFCFSGSRMITARLEEIRDAVAAISELEEGDAEKTEEEAHRIAVAWEKLFPRLSYVSTYTESNRADEAVYELYAAAKADAYYDLLAAKYKLLDALRRMLELESLSPSALF